MRQSAERASTLPSIFPTSSEFPSSPTGNQQAFHYHVVAFGKQGHFAKPLHTGTRIKLVVQAQSQPENISTLPLFTATFVRLVRPVARG